MRSIFYTLIAALAITHGAMAYDGYNIPCSYGGGGNCICDAGSCQEYSWNDSLETFMCGSGKGGNGKCSCVDAQYNKTIEFPCGCTSDSDCDGPGWGCINGQCQTCRTCSNCNTTSWTNGNTGYQTRTVRTCGCTTGQCTSNTEYRCAPGYYGTTSNGSTGCSRCSADSGVYGTTAAGSTARTNCYIETGTTFSDTSGSGRWDGRSYLCN